MPSCLIFWQDVIFTGECYTNLSIHFSYHLTTQQIPRHSSSYFNTWPSAQVKRGFILDKSMSKHTDTYLLTKAASRSSVIVIYLVAVTCMRKWNRVIFFQSKIFHKLHSNTSFAHTQTYSPDEWGLYKLQVLLSFSIMTMVFLCFNPYHIPWYCPFNRAKIVRL